MNKKVYRLSIILLLLALTAIAFDAREEELDVREADGIPVLWEQGLPYFARFTQTDHQQLDLAGAWKFKPDPDDEGIDEKWYYPGLDDSTWFDHPVPGSWNAQKHEWLYYQGVGWYRTKFTVPEGFMDRHHFARLVFDGVSYGAAVYLNDKLVGVHHGGFSRWSLDVTYGLNYEGPNYLAVRVDNRRVYDALPALKTEGGNLGWWFYGGIHRVAMIESAPQTTLAKLAVDTDYEGGIKGEAVLYCYQADKKRGVDTSEVEVAVALKDLSGNVVKELKRLTARVGATGMEPLRFSDKVEGIKPWSPATPENRYLLEITVSGEDASETQAVEIGFRTFEFRGLHPYLNGKKIFLRGINRHEDFPESGPVLTDSRIEEDMALLHELRVNFMRPAHYPNDPRWLDACDKEGILITHEIPFYQLGASSKGRKAVKGERLFNDAARHMIEMVERDRNHPSVVMWSVGNENHTFLPHVKKLHQRLIEITKRFDPERPVTFAISSAPVLTTLTDITAELADVLFLNEYFGWYHSKSTDLGKFLDQCHKKWPDKPMVISEFGAGAAADVDGVAKYNIGAVSKTFTYEYQEAHHRTTMEQILARDYICGTMPWIFADFRDDKRPDNPVIDFNLKGILTYDRQKKKSFYVFAEAYEKLEEKYGP